MMKVDASKNVIGADHLADKSYIGTIWVKLDPADLSRLEAVTERMEKAAELQAAQGDGVLLSAVAYSLLTSQRDRAVMLLRWLDAQPGPCPFCKLPLVPGSELKHRAMCGMAALLREVAE